MGVTAVLKLRQVAKNLETILGLEIFCAAQGIDFRKARIGSDAQLGAGTRDIYETIRERVPFIEEDCYMKAHMDEIASIVQDYLARGA